MVNGVKKIRKILAMMLAFVLMMTLMPENLQSVKATGTPSLYYRWAVQVSNTNDEWRVPETSDSEYTQTYNAMIDAKVYNVSTVVFYYKDANGMETLLDCSKLVSTDSGVVSLSDKGNGLTRLKYSEVGTAKIQYTDTNNDVYSVEVQTLLPDVGFYRQNVASKENLCTEFTVTDTNNTFYLIPQNGCTLQRATLMNDFAQIADITIDSAGYGVIMIKGDAIIQSNCFYAIEAEVGTPYGSTFNYWANICLNDNRAGLKFYYGEWHDNELSSATWLGLQGSWTVSPEPYFAFFQYCHDGVEEPVSTTELRSSDESVVKVKEVPGVSNATQLEVVGFGTAYIQYTKDGKTYSVKIESQLPDVGFYSSSSATVQNFVSSLDLAKSKTVYLVGTNGYTINKVEITPELAEIAICELENGIHKLTITGEPRIGWQYSVIVDATNTSPNGWPIEGRWVNFSITDSSDKLVFNWGDWNDDDLIENLNKDFNNMLWSSPGYSVDFFVYLESNGQKTRVSADQLCASTNNVLSVKESPLNPNAVRIDVEDFGSAEIKLKDDSSVKAIKIDSVLPCIGFYSTNTASKSSYIRNFEATTDNRTVYLVCDEDFKIRNVQLNGAFADSTVVVDKSEKYATITLPIGQGLCGYIDALVSIYNDFGYNDSIYCNLDCKDITPFSTDYTDQGIQAQSKIAIDTEITYNICDAQFKGYVKNVAIADGDANVVSITGDANNGWEIKAEKPGSVNIKIDYVDAQDATVKMSHFFTITVDCKHPQSAIVLTNKKNATCTEEGYTGDEMCQNCKAILKKGTVISKLAHSTKVEGAKAATCTEEGYAGDEVCQNCKAILKKGTVIPKLAHSTKVEGAKAATCTEEGYTGDEVCQTCKATVKKGTKIDKLGHSYTSTLQAATCTKDGEKTYLCSTCGHTYKETTTAVGHIYQNGVCSVCQEKDANYQPDTKVEVVTKDETKQAVNEVKDTIANTVSDAIKAAKKELEAGGETVSTEKLVSVVKESLQKSESEEVKVVAESVSEKTLEKVIMAIEENKEIEVAVVAQPLSVEEAKKIANEDVEKIEQMATAKGAVAQYLDLSVLIQAKDADNKVETLGKIEEATKELTFTLSVPENLKKEGRSFYIVRVHNNGEAEKIEVKDNQDGTITFTTDKFSTYALAYADTPKQELTPTPDPTPSQDTTTVVATTPEKVSPKTGDSNKVAEWSAIFAAGLGAMLVALKKKRQH